jgi:2-polyprenyl-3-methyl-5-hydroxy-6-metoxy-1,4-benzoquinol methylase
MIEIEREKAAAEGVSNLRFDRATLFDPELEEGSFDAVLAFNLLHLLEDIPAAIQRIRALPRPGGVLVSKTFCLAEQNRLWRLVLIPASALGLVPPIQCLRVAELEEIITRAGFEIVETGFYPRSPPSRSIVAGKTKTG